MSSNVVEKPIEITKVLNELDINRKQIAWNPLANRYARTLERVERILQEGSLENVIDKGFISKIEAFIKQCREPEFHIAIIGVVKAGKSTLINALLGMELASTSVTPETAVLTKVRSGHGKNKVKIRFYNQVEWNALWRSANENKHSTFFKEYNALQADHEKVQWVNHEEVTLYPTSNEELKEVVKEWTSSKDPKHYFVKEVEIGLADFNLPEQVVFVDTPGLNDAVRYRSDVTRNYIDRANAVILCAFSKTLNTGDLQTMYNVFANCRENPEKVYTIGTQLDLLNEPQKDWSLIKKQWISYLEGEDCYGSSFTASKNIFGLSAHMYNQAIHYHKLSKKEQRKLEFSLFNYDEDVEDVVEEAKKYSEIQTFKENLFMEIVQNHESLLIEELQSRFQHLQNELIDRLVYIKTSQSDLLESTGEDLEVITAKAKAKAQEVKEVKENQVTLQDILAKVESNNAGYLKELRKASKVLV
ncbi:dynamin family protein [Metabacillus iocasae]|uniref:GTPase Era involved in 16S rRNA processing n=1 Tax=Priestia iocasae TaxID=2291674 RepID=A0ABS2QY95_9BACI|nr:dynamin family protein [Metabacillus iocasae]MBM7704405.1 GTPase Era involved in 16S rRNA processing [Metabacillus iocasae]